MVYTTHNNADFADGLYGYGIGFAMVYHIPKDD